MPRRAEREQARKKMVEAAAIYLETGGVMTASIIEPLPGDGRLEIDLRVISNQRLDVFPDGAA